MHLLLFVINRKEAEYQLILKQQIEENKRRKEAELAKADPDFRNSPAYKLKMKQTGEYIPNNNNNNDGGGGGSGYYNYNQHQQQGLGQGNQMYNNSPYTQQQQQFFGMAPAAVPNNNNNNNNIPKLNSFHIPPTQKPQAPGYSNSNNNSYGQPQVSPQLSNDNDYDNNNNPMMNNYLNNNIQLQQLTQLMNGMVVSNGLNNNNPNSYPAGGTGMNSNNSKYVNQNEYDALSSLCSQLQQQQERLENEIREQAEIIKVSS